MSTNITIKYAKLPHGMVYFYQHWIPEVPRALVVFVHDLGDHIGRYGEFVSRFTSRGYAVALYDQRGHGRSDGRRGDVEGFMDWVNDLASFVHFSQMSVPTDTPLFIVGSGVGALIGFNFLLTHSAPVAGMVSISAAVQPALRIPKWKKKIASRLVGFIPHTPISTGVRPEYLTGDEGEAAAIKNDSLFHNSVTARALGELTRVTELVMAVPHRIYAPMLMLAGSADTICDPEGTARFASRLSSSDRGYHVYSGFRHDLLHETDRLRVMDDIEGWIYARATQKTQPDKQFALHRRETLWEDVSPPAC
ncbi:MAG: alpha/beta hydrolase [Pseudomonadota bacterium]